MEVLHTELTEVPGGVQEKLYPYSHPHPGILQRVGCRLFTPLFPLLSGYLPYQKAGYVYWISYPYAGYRGTDVPVQNLQKFRVRVLMYRTTEVPGTGVTVA